jgi:cation diffusion facilitator CzcD-associated flavoprotein CzcO
MKPKMSVGIIGAGPGGIALGILLARAGFRDFTIFDREDGVGGTWRAANGRVVTQWPRSARAFWEMTRRFRPADFAFEPAAVTRPAAYLSQRGGS